MVYPTVEEVWADFNPDGSVKEPAKEEIRHLLRFIQTMATAKGMKTYPNKATMDADHGQPAGTPALLWADPVDANNYPTVWTWDTASAQWVPGEDRIAGLNVQLDATADRIDDVRAGLIQQPQRASFQAKTGYAQTWLTISNPQTRWTITESANSFRIDTTAAVPQPWPVGLKMPYDLVPGDVIEAEFKITAGTIDGTVGPFIGTDTAVAGDISTGAIMYHWRNASSAGGVYGQNQTGTGGIVPGYETIPQAGNGAQPVPFVLNDLLRMRLTVLADRGATVELYVNNVLKITLSAPRPLPVGRVIIGILPPVSGSATITKVARIGFTGSTVHIDSGVAISGNGLIGTPVKTWDEAVLIAKDNRLSVCDVQILSAELRGAIVADGRQFSRYRIRGRGGAQTKIISADRNPTDWQLLAGTTKVWFRSNKNRAGSANTTQSGTIYLIGRNFSPTVAPWITIPDIWLPYFTDGAPADLEGVTGGARRVSNGINYVRLPDDLPNNPNSVAMEVNTSAATLYCIGAPHIECDNLVFSRGGIYNFYGDRATGIFRHCGFEWCESNNTEDAAGNFYYSDCYWAYCQNDNAARTFPAGYAETLLAPPVSFYDGCRMRGTVQGDGISNHGASVSLRAIMRVHNCEIEDCAKDGIVPASCDFQITNTRVRRCAQAQIDIIGGGTEASLPTGMFSNGFIADCTLDPGGLGLFAYLSSGAAGGKITATIDRTHFGVPASNSNARELRANVRAVAGRTWVPDDFVTTVTDCSFARDADTRQIDPNVSAIFNISGVENELAEINEVLDPIAAVVKPDGAPVAGVPSALRFAKPSGDTLGGFTEDGNLALLNGLLLAGSGGATLRKSTDPGVLLQLLTANGRVKLRYHADPTKDIIPGGTSGGSATNPLGAQIVMWIIYGQSLGQGAESLPPLSTSPTGSNAVKFVRGVRTWKVDAFSNNPEGRPSSDFNVVALTEAVNGGTGETAATAFAAMLKELVVGQFSPARRDGDPQILVTFPSQGGRLLDELSKVPVLPDPAGAYYATLVDDVRRAKLYAASLGKSFAVGGILWMGGESSNGGVMVRGGPILAYSDLVGQYQARLIQLADDLDGDIRGITGQSGRVPFFTYQTAGVFVGQAQLNAARAAPDKIIMVGPTYYVPGARNSAYNSPQVHGSEVHLSADGQRWFGSNSAKAVHRKLILREEQTIIEPMSARRINVRTFRVTFKVPRPPIKLDSILLPLQGGGTCGFALFNGTFAGQEPEQVPPGGPVITSVSVVDVDELEFTTAADLPVAATLAYGGLNAIKTVSTPVVTWRDGPTLPNGNPSKELVFAGSIRSEFAKALDEGAFFIDRLTPAPQARRKAWVGRTVVESGGQTIVRGEASEVYENLTFNPGDTVAIARQTNFGNVTDSDTATSTLSFADRTYGTRTGPYPLTNWLVAFCDLPVA